MDCSRDVNGSCAQCVILMDPFQISEHRITAWIFNHPQGVHVYYTGQILSACGSLACIPILAKGLILHKSNER